MEDISWKLIDKYFKDNPYNLVAHHLDSYNDFFSVGIYNIFNENNPIRFIEREENEKNEKNNECLLYLGGKNGKKIYFGKPIIYDESDKGSHYMYPNDARLRNMNYGITIHYDVDVDFIVYENKDETKKSVHSITLDKMYLGRFPIMLQSNLCILRNLPREVRFNMGECRNDYGGYFIIDGKEKSIVPQEKFANNMMYIRKNIDDDIYSYSCEIRSVSEDASKPIRTMAIKVLAPSTNLSNNQLLVLIPNVRKPIPLFILMRALGVVSDKRIIEFCLLDLSKNENMIDLFIPSVHDSYKIFNQENALNYIAGFTKRKTITSVLDILINYLLPHIGEKNFLDKAYFIGNMVFNLLKVFTGENKPTDRDNFKFKRIELSGTLIYDLFREYYLIQKKAISLKIDNEYYYHKGKYLNTFSDGKYQNNFVNLIQNNYFDFFKERTVEIGFKKAFKGNWGATTHTKKIGVVQDLNRLSWNSFMSQLRKINLPLNANAKVVGPRLLNSTQWGYIDPIDTPDGGNIGLHKHLAISTIITSGFSCWPLIKWLRSKTSIRILQECNPKLLGSLTKIFVNGIWIGGIDNPLELVKMIKLFRRNGIFPFYTSISFDYQSNEIFIYTDSGRLTRPIYYLDKGKISFKRDEIIKKINENRFTWEQIVTGFKEKSVKNYNYKNNVIYNIEELYPSLTSLELIQKELEHNKSVVDYIDTSEEERLMIANNVEELNKNKFYTNIEIDPSLILGFMGNLIIFPEHNPVTRNAFSCGQSKQAVSVYNSNYQVRIDKTGVVLNYGQIPLTKSRYLEYFNKEEQPYGVNAIVAIMSYTGYNVEDAILINEASIKRGLFRTTYLSMYETREESSKVSGSITNSVFADVVQRKAVGKKPGYDYSHLNKFGIIKENTPLDDTVVVIGKVTFNSENSEKLLDSSVFPKKGQLGFVDKAFITEGEEGFRIAKVRVREERIPAIGDKMASRSGQKGTIGLIIPEDDMPFTADGIRPDLIINPHAIPSRMTIGQLVETLLGKVATYYGGFGDCTAFQNKGPNLSVYGKALVNAGFHSTGNQVLYNGMTGEQLYSDIYIGPTYYMRLKHMVKDKINFRARGPNTALTRQSVQGRANDGGLRIGEMERDGIMAHGASSFLNDSYMVRADEYYIAVCNKTGGVAIYNSSLNLFISPFADGPVKFKGTVDGNLNVEHISRFGRSYSIVRIPYSLKLLIQELQVLNVQMRIITEDNIDNLMSMSYSNNMNKLLSDETSDLNELINNYKTKLMKMVRNEKEIVKEKYNYPEYNEEEEEVEKDEKEKEENQLYNIDDEIEDITNYDLNEISPEYAPNSPAYNPNSPEYAPNSPAYNPNSPAYNPNSPEYAPNSPAYNPNSPDYNPNSPAYNPNSPAYNPNSPAYNPNSPAYNQNSPIYNSNTNNISHQEMAESSIYPVFNPSLKEEYNNERSEFEKLPQNEKNILMEMINKRKNEKEQEKEIQNNETKNVSILDIEEIPKEKTQENGDNNNESSQETTKKIISL
jgi:DNA-directed RNA polymerase II subunit RPB2